MGGGGARRREEWGGRGAGGRGPASSRMSAIEALSCVERPRFQARSSASWMRRARPSASARSSGGISMSSTDRPCTSRAKTRHCWGRSTSCQGVSVPPQSKMTASMAGVGSLTPPLR